MKRLCFLIFIFTSSLFARDDISEGSIKLRKRQEANLYIYSKISLEEAVKIAQKKIESSVYEVQLKNESGFLVYEVRFADNTSRTRIYVDAGNGNILGTKSFRISKTILAKVVPAEQVMKTALGRYPGKIIELELRRRRNAIYEITIVVQNNVIITAVFNAFNGEFSKVDTDDE